MKIYPADATLGATVYDIDLWRLDNHAAEEIVDAWHEYAVLVFPKQHLDDNAQIAFSHLFGNLERLLTASIVAENSEVFRVANVRPDGTIDKPGESYELFHRGNQYWHTDSSYKVIPSKASVLRGKTVPQVSSDQDHDSIPITLLCFLHSGGRGGTRSQTLSRCLPINIIKH